MIISKVELDKTRFGRRRLLAGIGTALTTAAGAAWFPQRASAVCPLPGCYGYDMCPSCYKTQCTSPGCYSGFFGCDSGVQCWRRCVSHNLYSCCDWGLPGFHGTCTGADNFCICRGYQGSC
jgi:hypothetical protein